MKLNKLAVALFTVVVGFASANAQATIINVGGVVWDTDSFFDFSSTTNLYETTAANTGDTISGYGLITSVNATSPTTFCPSGCELTYLFSGYTLLAATSFNALGTGINADGSFSFTGGTLTVFVDTSADFNALIKATAGADGDTTVWLQLVGSDGGDFFGPNVTLHGTITGANSVGLTGQGTGYLDAVGGLALANIDTNSQPGGSDLTYTSSFQALSAPLVNGGVVVATAFGTNEIFGDSIAVPEPASIALLGLGLLGLALSRRNRKAA